jgi:hypothetical protein
VALQLPCKAKIHGTKAGHKDGHGKVVLSSVPPRVEEGGGHILGNGSSAVVKTVAQGPALA